MLQCNAIFHAQNSQAKRDNSRPLSKIVLAKDINHLVISYMIYQKSSLVWGASSKD